jgi:hypothetical protein
MRCLNCSTVCLETETRCISCGYQMAEPEEFVPKTRLAKWGCGIPMLQACGLLSLVALACAYGAYDSGNDRVQAVTAAELLSVKGPADVKEGWVSYRFTKSLHTNIRKTVYVRGGQRVLGYYLLVQVGDRWALVLVPNHFSGNRVEGQVQAWDAEFSDTMSQVAKRYPTQTKRLLPIVIDAERSYAVSARWLYIAAGVIGLLGVLSGVGAARYLGTKLDAPAPPAPAASLGAAFRVR